MQSQDYLCHQNRVSQPEAQLEAASLLTNIHHANGTWHATKDQLNLQYHPAINMVSFKVTCLKDKLVQ